MPAEPVILSLETATLGGSIFLSRGRTKLATRLGDSAISHSNTILVDINQCLTEANIRIDDVNLFACASGPGSFTGLRIGIATVKALAATLERPCVGIPTLAAIAQAAGISEATVSLLPAGRGEVFAQQFQVSGNDEIMSSENPAHLSPEKLMDRYGGLPSVVWAGPGAHIHHELLEEQARKRGIHFAKHFARSEWRLAPPETNLAQHVAILALKNFLSGQTPGAENLHAIYVRPSDAEMNQSWR